MHLLHVAIKILHTLFCAPWPRDTLGSTPGAPSFNLPSCLPKAKRKNWKDPRRACLFLERDRVPNLEMHKLDRDVGDRRQQQIAPYE